MLAPEYLVLIAISEFISARGPIRKHTKVDKDGFLSISWFLSKHGWHLPHFSEQRIPSNMQVPHKVAGSDTSSENLSVGLSASEAEIVSNLGFPVAEHSIWSTTENGQPASFSNSENQLVPPAGEPGTISTESAPLAPYVLEILENRVV